MAYSPKVYYAFMNVMKTYSFKIKKPATRAGFSVSDKHGLFDFAFFVDDVFTNHWIVFRHFHFIRRSFFVLIGGVEMTGTSRRDHADFIAFG
jgi:hypothetical protein